MNTQERRPEAGDERSPGGDYSFRVVEMDDLKARPDELERFLIRKQEAEALDRGRKAAEGGEEYEDED